MHAVAQGRGITAARADLPGPDTVVLRFKFSSRHYKKPLGL
jgi:hypothetical protein